MLETLIVILLFFLGTALCFIPQVSFLCCFLATSIALTILYGKYLATLFDDKPTWLTPLLAPLEKYLLSIIGVRDIQPMTWQTYCKALLLFNGCAGLLMFALLYAQPFLPLNVLHLPALHPTLILNIVCGFITNTDWQSYIPEQTLSNFSQMAVLTFGMVVGSITGLSVFIAFIRGLTGRALGNFYQDGVRSFLYVFLPVMVVGSLFFIAQGVPQTFHQQVIAKTVEGAAQKIAMGPVASLETIKLFGTNGGGFFNANSAHPYENPNPFTNAIEIMLQLAIPMALLTVFGQWLKDKKQAWLVWSFMTGFFLLAIGVAYYFELSGTPFLSHLGIHPGNMEGKEARFGIFPSMSDTVTATTSSTGAVNNMHDSLTPIGGMVPMVDLMLNVIYGGVGVGMMNFIVYGIIAVFLTGLMVGRTPEIFGKKLDKPEMILATLVLLLHPLLSMLPTAIAAISSFGLSSLNNLGPHGFSEILYAYTSASADNGSAFAGLNTNTPWYNVSIGLVILLGRYLPIIALLALSSSQLSKPLLTPHIGTLKTNTLTFTLIWAVTIVVMGALTFAPALVLGPICEQLSMTSGKTF